MSQFSKVENIPIVGCLGKLHQNKRHADPRSMNFLVHSRNCYHVESHFYQVAFDFICKEYLGDARN